MILVQLRDFVFSFIKSRCASNSRFRLCGAVLAFVIKLVSCAKFRSILRGFGVKESRGHSTGFVARRGVALKLASFLADKKEPRATKVSCRETLKWYYHNDVETKNERSRRFGRKLLLAKNNMPSWMGPPQTNYFAKVKPRRKFDVLVVSHPWRRKFTERSKPWWIRIHKVRFRSTEPYARDRNRYIDGQLP